MGNGQSFDCSMYLMMNATTNVSVSYMPPDSASTNSTTMWFIGIAFTLASAMAVSLGTVLQKKAHVTDLEKPPELRAPRKAGILCNRLWLCGFLMMALLQIPLTFVALALAPQSLVIPLGAGSTIILTQLLAVCVLKESIGRIDVIATIIILIGVVMTTTANGSVTKSLTACQILNRYTEGDFLVPMLVLLFCITAAVVLLHHEGACCSKKMLPAMFAFVAGGLGAILNIMLKVVGEFTQGALSGSVQAQGAWNSVHPYYHLVIVLFMAVGMISFINQGLERFNAISFLPLYNCLFIVLTTLLGALFFREFDTYGSQAIAVFTIGITLTVFGVALISCVGAAPEHKVAGMDDFDEDGMEMGGRRRGPSDPIEGVWFDADTELDAKKYSQKPIVSKLVLI